MKILLIDILSIFHRAYPKVCKTLGEYKDVNGNYICGTYGFFTTVLRAWKEFGPFDKFVLARDVKGGSLMRKQESSLYKANREPKDKKFYDDLNLLIKYYLPKLDILPLGLKGYEADDIIACACRYITTTYEQQDYEIFILSGDKDLEQCVRYSDKIKFIKTQPKWELKTYDDIVKKWGVEPSEIPLIMAMTGDNADNIPGIRGIGRKRAKKNLHNEEFLEQHKDIISTNLKLVTLKDDLDVAPFKAKFNSDTLRSIFTELKATKMLDRLDRLEFIDT